MWSQRGSRRSFCVSGSSQQVPFPLQGRQRRGTIVQMRTLRPRNLQRRALACYMTLGKSLSLCGLLSHLTLRGGEQLDKNLLGLSLPRQPHPTWHPLSTGKAFAHSSLKATCNVHEIGRDSERLRDSSQAAQCSGDTNVTLPACMLDGHPWPGQREVLDQGSSRVPLYRLQVQRLGSWRARRQHYIGGLGFGSVAT